MRCHHKGWRRLTTVSAYAVLAAWSVVCVFPVYWLAVTSLKGADDIIRPGRYLPFLDFVPTLDSWRFILTDPTDNLVARFLASLWVGTMATLLAIAAATFAAYGLTRFVSRIPANGIMLGILGSRILPPVAVVLPVYLMAQWAGAIDTMTVLVAVYAAVNLPVALWLVHPVLGPRVTEQEEAARIDGASHLRILVSIVLPMAAGGVAAAAVLVFVLCWNEYLIAAYLTTRHALTLPPWMAGQMSAREAQIGGEPEEWAHLSAAALLMILPPFLLTGWVRRALLRRTPGRP